MSAPSALVPPCGVDGRLCSKRTSRLLNEPTGGTTAGSGAGLKQIGAFGLDSQMSASDGGRRSHGPWSGFVSGPSGCLRSDLGSMSSSSLAPVGIPGVERPLSCSHLTYQPPPLRTTLHPVIPGASPPCRGYLGGWFSSHASRSGSRASRRTTAALPALRWSDSTWAASVRGRGPAPRISDAPGCDRTSCTLRTG